MGISDRVSDTSWKWWCKTRNLVKSPEKTLADFKSDSSSSSTIAGGDPKDAPDGNNKDHPTKDRNLGSAATVKTFYEGPGSGQGHYNWVDYPPRQLSKSAAKAQDRVAIRLYKVKDEQRPVINGRFALRYHSIEVQNPGLAAALAPILRRREDVHLDVGEPARFHEPFRSLYFCYDEIVARHRACVAEEEGPLATFLLLFIKVLDEVFGEVRAKRRNLLASGLVSFETAWTFFARDAPVICQGPNCEFMCKVVNTTMVRTQCGSLLHLRAKVLQLNGEAFVWEENNFVIPEFEGNKPIAELRHYPLEFHEDVQAVRKRMDARGRMVLDYQGLTYCTYDGVAVYQKDKVTERHNVDGRILIDVIGYNKFHLAKGERDGQDAESRKRVVAGTGRKMPPLPPSHVVLRRNQSPHDYDEIDEELANMTETVQQTKSTESKRLSEEEQEKNRATMLARPDDLMYMSPLLEGYALKNKLWVSFYVEDIRPIVWNEHAFRHLVYEEQQKDLVLSFVESHGRTNNQQMDDVILGKGQGLIMLLSGPPGTGKTLMAEAVADRSRRPLFYLQAEDLGINAATLGANIKKVLAMASEWDAVVLLDEADVFMAERHPHDIARNELVSIFLRELEYYSGIIFLTTNLYQTVDTAFRSRVSLHLLFRPLSAEARALVWRKFLGRLPGFKDQQQQVQDQGKKKGKVVSQQQQPTNDGVGEVADSRVKRTIDITDEDIKELAQWQLNGREIKNAVKMVKSWCDHKGHDMTLARLENGIRVTSPHASRCTTTGDVDLYDD